MDDHEIHDAFAAEPLELPGLREAEARDWSVIIGVIVVAVCNVPVIAFAAIDPGWGHFGMIMIGAPAAGVLALVLQIAVAVVRRNKVPAEDGVLLGAKIAAIAFAVVELVLYAMPMTGGC